jgi:hypothetical protein
LKEEALDGTQWRTRFGRRYGPVVRQTAEWRRYGPVVRQTTEWRRYGPVVRQTAEWVVSHSGQEHYIRQIKHGRGNLRGFEGWRHCVKCRVSCDKRQSDAKTVKVTGSVSHTSQARPGKLVVC